MNDTNDETVRFSVKPNPFLYALEVTRHTLLAGTAGALSIIFFPFMGLPFMWPGLYSERVVVVLLITYALLGLALLIVAFVTACCLTFVVTDKRAIVRFSSSAMISDDLSIAIESVEHIE